MYSVCWHWGGYKKNRIEDEEGGEYPLEGGVESHTTSSTRTNTGTQPRVALAIFTLRLAVLVWSIDIGCSLLTRFLILMYLGQKGKGRFCVENHKSFWRNNFPLSWKEKWTDPFVRSSKVSKGQEFTLCYAMIVNTGFKQFSRHNEYWFWVL